MGVPFHLFSVFCCQNQKVVIENIHNTQVICDIYMSEKMKFIIFFNKRYKCI